MNAVPTEIERFERLAATWWNDRGPMRPLHVINRLRLDYVLELVGTHLRPRGPALEGLRVLDVGCGAGLLSEPLDDRPHGPQLRPRHRRRGVRLRVLPRGTHQWRRFVRPSELHAAARAGGLAPIDLRGMRYLPVLHRAGWTRDSCVNYLAAYRRPVGPPVDCAPVSST